MLRHENTTKKIVELMSPPKETPGRLPYNVRPRSHKRTIEFRGHEGTLDSERIVNWINVCVGLVEFADTIDPDELDKFLWSHIDYADEFTVIDLLRVIGRPAEAEFYAKRFEEHPELLEDDDSSIYSQ